MESQEEYNREVQELYDWIQQQMDQEINKAKKQQQAKQMPKIVEEEDKVFNYVMIYKLWLTSSI